VSTPSRRTLILDTALALIEDRGAQDVRLSDVAEAAGVSRQALYKHFGSRSALFAQAMGRADEVSELRELAADVRAATTGEEELAAFAGLQAVHNPRIRAIARAIDEARRTDDGAAEAWAVPYAARRAACARIVKRLDDEGVLAPSWELAAAADLLYVLTSVRTWEAVASIRRPLRG
jgi:AcrR family transcriptional regulator